MLIISFVVWILLGLQSFLCLKVLMLETETNAAVCKNVHIHIDSPFIIILLIVFQQ